MVNTKIFATMLVILASIMGTSFAAERSVPGDSLYAFKLGVNENFRGALSIGAEADARWEIEKIERRARERAVLEARSETTVKTETDIETRSQASVEKAQRHILELQSE
jgi:SLT domain-containing protein